MLKEFCRPATVVQDQRHFVKLKNLPDESRMSKTKAGIHNYSATTFIIEIKEYILIERYRMIYK